LADLERVAMAIEYAEAIGAPPRQEELVGKSL